MATTINADRTAVGGPPPKGVVIAVDHESGWYFIIRYGDKNKLVLPMPRAEAIGHLLALVESEHFESIEAHARRIARTLDMDYRVVVDPEPELQDLIDAIEGVTRFERESLVVIADALGDLAA